MEYYLAIYSSVTLANRVKRQMAAKGDRVNVIHTPKSISKGGCSYALRFKKNRLPIVIQISQEFGIKIKSIYKESVMNGQKVYVPVNYTT